MATLFVAYDNHVDAATLAGGSWESTLPLSNLAKQQPTTVARTTNDAEASSIITANLGGRKLVNVVAVIHHNLSPSATWRVRIGNTSDYSTNLVDTTAVDAIDATEEFGEMDWGGFTWGGKPTAAELSTFNPIALYYNATGVMAQYVRIDISDTSNTDEYIEAGRLYVATAFAPTDGVAYGLTTAFIDESRAVRSRGGQVFVDAVPKRRQFGFRFHSMNEAEAYTSANEIQRSKGLSGDVLVAIDADDTTNRMRQTIYGRLVQLAPIVHANTTHFTTDVVVEELI